MMTATERSVLRKSVKVKSQHQPAKGTEAEEFRRVRAAITEDCRTMKSVDDQPSIKETIRMLGIQISRNTSKVNDIQTLLDGQTIGDDDEHEGDQLLPESLARQLLNLINILTDNNNKLDHIIREISGN